MDHDLVFLQVLVIWTSWYGQATLQQMKALFAKDIFETIPQSEFLEVATSQISSHITSQIFQMQVSLL